jgi:hypothetical protein
MKVFCFYCDNQSNLSVVVAPDEETAYEKLALLQLGGGATEFDEDDIAHVKEHWKIAASAAADKPLAVCWSAVDRSEGHGFGVDMKLT